MNKRDINIYRVVTGLFSLLILFQVVMYFYMHDMVRETFERLGVPGSIVYPLAIAKFLGLVAIWTNKSRLLKELAYLGFAVDFVMASAAHMKAGDDGVVPPIIALIIMLVSFFYPEEFMESKRKWRSAKCILWLIEKDIRESNAKQA